jgi:hypothetical protein
VVYGNPTITRSSEQQSRAIVYDSQYGKKGGKKQPKTYNSGYSLVVTHPTTNPTIWSNHLDSS